MQERSDLELIKAFQTGDQSSFEELLSRYTARAFSLAQRLTKSPQDAEEVLQDVFVTVYRKISGFEGKSSFSSWLYRITVNTSLMKLRKRRQNRCIASEDVGLEVEQTIVRNSLDYNLADREAMRSQMAAVLEQAISRLPEEYRPVFLMRDVDGLSSREVGKILQITIPAVKSRLHRSRSMLRRKLAMYYREYSEGGSAEPRKIAGNE